MWFKLNGDKNYNFMMIYIFVYVYYKYNSLLEHSTNFNKCQKTFDSSNTCHFWYFTFTRIYFMTFCSLQNFFASLLIVFILSPTTLFFILFHIFAINYKVDFLQSTFKFFIFGLYIHVTITITILKLLSIHIDLS